VIGVVTTVAGSARLVLRLIGGGDVLTCVMEVSGADRSAEPDVQPSRHQQASEERADELTTRDRVETAGNHAGRSCNTTWA
jgi:hypothetical protein